MKFHQEKGIFGRAGTGRPADIFTYFRKIRHDGCSDLVSFLNFQVPAFRVFSDCTRCAAPQQQVLYIVRSMSIGLEMEMESVFRLFTS